MSVPAVNWQCSGNRFSNRQSGTPYGVEALPPVIPATPGNVPASFDRQQEGSVPPVATLAPVGGAGRGFLAGTRGEGGAA